MRTRHWLILKYFVVEFIGCAKLLDHLQDLGIGQFSLIHINRLNVSLKLDWPVDLNLFVGSNHSRPHFVCFTT